MEELIQSWDGETVITRFDHQTGTWIFIAIHSTRLGSAAGGTRMKVYPDPVAALRDAMRLAEGMTEKFAIGGMPRGGGKAVLAIPPDLDLTERAALLRRYGASLAQLGGYFQTGPDVGTSSADMDIIAETGAPHVFARTPANGGAGDSGPATAVGVLAGIKVVCERLFGSSELAGRRVLVQGAGSVGGRLIGDLRAAGAEVLFSEVDLATAARVRETLGVEPIAPEVVFETSCDIFAPCALGAVLSAESIPRLRCRAVAGSANNQLAAPEDAERLLERGILYAPDVVVNFGGAMFLLGRELLGWTEAETEQHIRESIAGALRQVFALADASDISTTAAAERLAEQRIAGAAGHV
jgi:leucine dehydrogenase